MARAVVPKSTPYDARRRGAARPFVYASCILLYRIVHVTTSHVNGATVYRPTVLTLSP